MKEMEDSSLAAAKASKPKMRIVLVAPRIPQNVGNIARTALALGAELSLVGPLGFIWNESQASRVLKRSSVGYWPKERPHFFVDFQDFWARFPRHAQTQFIFATKRGQSDYSRISYTDDVVLLFGNEEEGIPESFWSFDGLPEIVSCRIPTQSVRCLNLSVAVAVLGFEVQRFWRNVGIYHEAQETSATGL